MPARSHRTPPQQWQQRRHETSTLPLTKRTPGIYSCLTGAALGLRWSTSITSREVRNGAHALRSHDDNDSAAHIPIAWSPIHHNLGAWSRPPIYHHVRNMIRVTETLRSDSVRRRSEGRDNGSTALPCRVAGWLVFNGDKGRKAVSSGFG